MNRYIAFLRAINVGGHTVRMEELRAHFETLGLVNVETFIASGNIIFETDQEDIRALEGQIENHLQETLGFPVATFLRSDHELSEIAHYQAFAPAQLDSAQALNVAFLAAPLSEESQGILLTFTSDIDKFHHHGREVYWLCRKKQSESNFSNAVFERALKLKSTIRGLNTIIKLTAKYPPDGRRSQP